MKKRHQFKPQHWMKVVGIFDKKFIRAMAYADEYAMMTATKPKNEK